MNRFWILFGFFAVFIWVGCTPKMHLSKVDNSTIKFEQNSAIKPSEDIEAIVKPYRDQLKDKMNEVLCMSAKNLSKTRMESTLGNWVGDALMHQALQEGHGPIDLMVQNYGGLRIPAISKGPVTTMKMYELMPFDNELVILEMKGKTLLELLDRIATYGGWPCSSGISMLFNDEGVIDVSLAGEEIHKENNYRVGMPDYIANGGDSFDFLVDLKRTKTGLLIRDLLIAECRFRGDNGESISANIESRMVKK